MTNDVLERSVTRGRQWPVLPLDTLAIAIAAFGAIPLLMLTPAPLGDWPSHLARVWITNQVLHGNSFWTERYQFNGLLIPNAILDAVVLGLMRLGLSVNQAGLGFLLLCYATFVAGFVRLARLGGHSRLAGVSCAILLFFTGNVIDGLVNYTAGIAVMLLACSVWFQPNASFARRIAIACIATPAIMFCHILSAFIFAGVCVTHDLFRHSHRWITWFRNLTPSVLALAIALAGYWLSAVAGDSAGGLEYRDGWGLLGLLRGKLSVARDALSCGNPIGDAVFAAAGLGVLALCWRARKQIDVTHVAPVVALAALFLVAPYQAGEASLVDTRIFVLPLILAMAMLPWSPEAARVAPLWLALAATLRTAVLAVSWMGYAPAFAGVEAALATVPPGATLLAAYGDADPAFYPTMQPPLWNSASLAVMDGVFVPSVFASPTQQPLAVRPKWRPDWLWPHYANARTPERLAATKALGRRFCATDPHTFLFVLGPPGQPPSIENLCLR